MVTVEVAVVAAAEALTLIERFRWGLRLSKPCSMPAAGLTPRRLQNPTVLAVAVAAAAGMLNVVTAAARRSARGRPSRRVTLPVALPVTLPVTLPAAPAPDWAGTTARV